MVDLSTKGFFEIQEQFQDLPFIQQVNPFTQAKFGLAQIGSIGRFFRDSGREETAQKVATLEASAAQAKAEAEKFKNLSQLPPETQKELVSNEKEESTFSMILKFGIPLLLVAGVVVGSVLVIRNVTK
jgi:hypothetical protein